MRFNSSPNVRSKIFSASIAVLSVGLLLIGLTQFNSISAQIASDQSIPLSHITPVVWEGRGSGDSLSPSVNLSAGVVIVDVNYEGTSYEGTSSINRGILEIEFLKTDGSDSHRFLYKFIPEGEDYYGAHASNVYSRGAALSPGSYRIQINSEGSWHVDVSQPRRDTGIELPRFVQGSGDGGSFAFSFSSGLVPIYYEYSGPADRSGSLLAITLYKMDGSETERIIYDFVTADELPKSGIASVTVHESSGGDITPGVYLLRVQSEGNWRIALGADSFTTPTSTPVIASTLTPTVVPTGTTVPTHTPTATPIPPTVPDDVLNRLSALETLVATLQGLISALESKIGALDGRIAALEAGESMPEPTPTPVPVAPTSTPAPVGPTPTPTPTTGEPPAPTPTPSPIPTPIAADPCIDEFTDSGSKVGSWSGDCESVNSKNMIIITDRGSGPHYALYYTFTLDAPADVTVTLDSDEDTFLYLLAGKGANVGELEALGVQHYNDDHSSLVDTDACADDSNLEQYDSCISKSLTAGSYTIEATTYETGAIGAFTVTLTK